MTLREWINEHVWPWSQFTRLERRRRYISMLLDDVASRLEATKRTTAELEARLSADNLQSRLRSNDNLISDLTYGNQYLTAIAKGRKNALRECGVNVKRIDEAATTAAIEAGRLPPKSPALLRQEAKL